ncbi:MAG TPA: shikimate dehydrogenase [Aggregatilineales bacterium]|nr:shikimate dehydrogenase [Aggregatilineales bacterium]
MPIDAQTQLVGVIGWPVAHSISPAIQNAAFSYAGLNWRYVPLPVHTENLAAAIRGLAALGFRGANITIPHKVDVIPLLDAITESVTVAGAVNTIRIDRNTSLLEGLNTDMGGFLTDLAANKVKIGKDSRAVILGAGGAARAAAAALVRSGAHVYVINRTPGHAEGIVKFVQSSWSQPNIEMVYLENLYEASRGVGLIVNATPVGQWPNVDASPWPEKVPFPEGATIYDMVYRPLKTKFMQDAERAGLRALGGLGMLVYQGAAAYDMWTGKRAPIDVMKVIAMQTLSENAPPNLVGVE